MRESMNGTNFTWAAYSSRVIRYRLLYLDLQDTKTFPLTHSDNQWNFSPDSKPVPLGVFRLPCVARNKRTFQIHQDTRRGTKALQPANAVLADIDPTNNILIGLLLSFQTMLNKINNNYLLYFFFRSSIIIGDPRAMHVGLSNQHASLHSSHYFSSFSSIGKFFCFFFCLLN